MVLYILLYDFIPVIALYSEFFMGKKKNFVYFEWLKRRLLWFLLLCFFLVVKVLHALS